MEMTLAIMQGIAALLNLIGCVSLMAQSEWLKSIGFLLCGLGFGCLMVTNIK